MIRFAAVGDFPIRFGRYLLVERLAIGGMAELFLATSPGEHGFQKRVVIKRLLPSLVEDKTYTAMFIDEAKLTARLVHPKIAQTFELGQVDGTLYIAMEHVDGIDVLALLREFASRRRRIEQPLAAWIAHEVLDALDYAHNLAGEDGAPLGIVHRDISPSNVLLSGRGDIKLVDFGIARAIDPEREHKSKTGTLKGKYGYMSPEQVIEQGLDSRSDLFSVGVVLAELLTGRRLFAAANELDVLLMVRDAKLHRLDKYGAGHRAGPRGDRAQGAPQAGRRALADGDRVPRRARRVALRAPPPRHEPDGGGRRGRAARRRDRATPAPDERRSGRDAAAPADREVSGGAGVGAPAAPTPPVASSPPSPPALPDSDGVIVMVADPGDSMPNISVSYEAAAAAHPEPAPSSAATRRRGPWSRRGIRSRRPRWRGPPGRPRRAGAAPRSRSRWPRGAAAAERAAVAAGRAVAAVGAGRHGAQPDRHDDADRAPRDRAAGPERPAAAPPALGRAVRVAAARRTQEPWALGSPAPDAIRGERAAGSAPIRVPQGVVRGDRGPIPDTISAAVEAIALRPSIELPVEDSAISTFDDLAGAPRAGDIRRPTEEEVLRTQPPAPPALADIPEPPDDSGDLSTTPPLQVLFRLMMARATGLLVVAVGGDRRTSTSATACPSTSPRTSRASCSATTSSTKGVLSDGELAMALAMMPHYGGKLGDTLVGLGLMKPLEVFRHLTRQVRTKIIDVCSWNKGTFAWYAGRENPREAFPLDFNAFEILGAGAMAMADDYVEAWIARHGDVRLRLARSTPHRPRALRGARPRRALRAPRRPSLRERSHRAGARSQRAPADRPHALPARGVRPRAPVLIAFPRIPGGGRRAYIGPVDLDRTAADGSATDVRVDEPASATVAASPWRSRRRARRRRTGGRRLGQRVGPPGRHHRRGHRSQRSAADGRLLPVRRDRAGHRGRLGARARRRCARADSSCGSPWRCTSRAARRAPVAVVAEASAGGGGSAPSRSSRGDPGSSRALLLPGRTRPRAWS